MSRRKPSRSSSKKRRPSISQIIFYVLSLVIVLSMTIGFVISMLPTPTDQPSVVTPTPVIFATITPTPTQEPTTTLTPAIEEPSADGEASPQPDQ
ncbi:MAG: hypothetical protein JSV81_06300 [Anaerolineales bacterium]|nr:MAG: hypothetical protein JSV81_06300 [Anaerolineales bacterium]